MMQNEIDAKQMIEGFTQFMRGNVATLIYMYQKK